MNKRWSSNRECKSCQSNFKKQTKSKNKATTKRIRRDFQCLAEGKVSYSSYVVHMTGRQAPVWEPEVALKATSSLLRLLFLLLRPWLLGTVYTPGAVLLDFTEGGCSFSGHKLRMGKPFLLRVWQLTGMFHTHKYREPIKSTFPQGKDSGYISSLHE